MKSLFAISLTAAALLVFSSCSEKTPERTAIPAKTEVTAAAARDNSQSSLDWSGSYKGVLPCADCSGVETEITLSKDLTYIAKFKYIGKSEAVISESGTFNWDQAGAKITLKGPKSNTLYKVGENHIIQLDVDGNEISGELANNYILTKQLGQITDTKWVLIELYGKPISPGNGLNMAPHITLNTAKNKVLGNSGCNSIGGAFVLEGSNGIKMTNIFATMTSCGDPDSENLFQRALRNALTYELKGNELILTEPEWAVSARLVKE
jgi:uncharacterized lipoprotein NlpE involved in copper resistance